MTISLLSRRPASTLHGRDASRPAPQGVGGGVQAIGRSRLAYRWFAYPRGAERRDAQRAAAMAARAWTPFPETAMFLVAGKLGMSAWAWRPFDAGPEPVPATLLQPPGQDGARLLRHPDGVEAQVWLSGELRASRCWVATPDADAWRSFLRAAGVAPDQQGAPPAPIDPIWRSTPFGRRWNEGSLEIPGFPEGMSVDWLSGANLRRGFLAIALFAAAFVSGDAARAWVDLRTIEARVALEESRIRAARADRDAALAATAQNQPLASLAARSSPLSLLAAVAAALPEEGVRLIDWFQQPSDLSATLIVVRPLDGAALVRRLEAIPGVSGVTLDGAGGSEERVVRLRLALAR